MARCPPSGYSKKVSYLAKTQRICVSAPHEIYMGHPDDPNAQESCLNWLINTASAEQLGDICTKGLEHVSHWRLLQNIGMVIMDRYDEEEDPDNNSSCLDFP